MTRHRILPAAVVIAAVSFVGRGALADGDAEQGAKAFRACAACHSLQAGDHRTGPSLAGVFGKKAGLVETFNRYSKALKDSGLTWNAEALDRWMKDPKELVPGNRMIFRGVAEKKDRDDLIAFLRSASDRPKQAAGGRQEGMGGMMGNDGGEFLNLRELEANNRVTAIAYCKDTFNVTTATGETHPFWSLNLRIKVDSSDKGPAPGKPALIPAGMMGDRASVVFALPDEISPFIKKGC